MTNDPIVDAVRQTRDALAQASGYDVHTIFTELRRREMMVNDRLVRRPEDEVGKNPAATKLTSDSTK